MSDFQGQDAAAAEILDAIAEEGDDAPIDSPALREQPIDNGDEDEHAGGTDIDMSVTAKPAKQHTPADIEPPVSWKAEAKEQFKALTPELKRFVADRESERERGSQQAAQKALEQATALENERKAYVERLKTFVDVAKVNPRLAEWQQRDWVKFARENPLDYPAERLEFEQTIQAIGQAQQEASRVDQQSLSERRQKAHQELLANPDLADTWGDDKKRQAFVDEFRGFIKGHNFSEVELDSIDDPRLLVIGRKAMLYDKLMAQQSQIAATKKPPAQAKRLGSQSTSDDAGSPRAEALLKRAMKTGKTDDQVAAIMARL